MYKVFSHGKIHGYSLKKKSELFEMFIFKFYIKICAF